MTAARIPESNPTSRRVLRTARAILAERGIAKQTHRAPDGTVCAFGAVEEARIVIGIDHGDDMLNATAALLYECERRGCGQLSSYNDAAGTTLPMMLDIFDSAVELV